MKMQLLGELLILSICARCAFASYNSELSDYPVMSDEDSAAVRQITTVVTALATTEESFRSARYQRHDREGFVALDSRADHHDEGVESHDHVDTDAPADDDTEAMSEARTDYWGGYYDFLINEGSYKFWAIFQLATAALLIYSGFAALYYAKVNPQISDDYDDFLLRRRRRSVDRDRRPPRDRPYFGMDAQTFQRIFDAIAMELH